MLIAAGIILSIIVIGVLVLNYYPSLGGRLSKQQREQFSHLDIYSRKKFVNPIQTSMDLSMREKLILLGQIINGEKNTKPASPLIPEQLSTLYFEDKQQPKLTWFGHSAALLQMDGYTLLLDPMLGKAPSPFPLIGGKRFSNELPIEITQLPHIDAVFISHDHYDHLDYGTIIKLKDKVKRFFVPLGVGQHLVRWGIERARIEEHNWWDEFEWEGFKLACTPARHFSGRSLTDKDATLWCSWVIHGRDKRVFFCGDSGYGPHFKEIGRKYGPFDLTLMECGQYDDRWAAIHMRPEETVQAHLDVQGNVLIPIHWGAFTLALHSWTDPIERAVNAARQQNVHIATPKIGETVFIGSAVYPSSVWWK